MNYTIAIEPPGTIWGLLEFERLYGELSVNVGVGYNGQPQYYGIFDLQSNHNIVAYVSHSLRAQRYDDKNNIIVVVLSSGFYCVCKRMKRKEWETIDLDIIFREEHIVSRSGSEGELDKLVQYCEENSIKYHVCKSHSECFYGVIWEEGDVINIWGHDGDGNYRKLQFDHVKSWARLSQQIGTTELLYSFFCLKIQDYSVILNIKTLNFRLSIAMDIHPTDLLFHKDYYRYSKNYSITCDCNEHVWADNKLYDEWLNEVAVLAQVSTKEDKILDFLSRYVAVENFWGICIYELCPVIKDGINCYEVNEVRYRCPKDISSKSVRLRLDNNSLDYAYFDALQKKFIVDAEGIKEEFRRRHDYSEDYSDPWREYDVINDGLDGEVDAYWGLLD